MDGSADTVPATQAQGPEFNHNIKSQRWWHVLGFQCWAGVDKGAQAQEPAQLSVSETKQNPPEETALKADLQPSHTCIIHMHAHWQTHEGTNA